MKSYKLGQVAGSCRGKVEGEQVCVVCGVVLLLPASVLSCHSPEGGGNELAMSDWESAGGGASDASEIAG